jgi:hypothetical protein
MTTIVFEGFMRQSPAPARQRQHPLYDGNPATGRTTLRISGGVRHFSADGAPLMCIEAGRGRDQNARILGTWAGHR